MDEAPDLRISYDLSPSLVSLVQKALKGFVTSLALSLDLRSLTFLEFLYVPIIGSWKLIYS